MSSSNDQISEDLPLAELTAVERALAAAASPALPLPPRVPIEFGDPHILFGTLFVVRRTTTPRVVPSHTSSDSWASAYGGTSFSYSDTSLSFSDRSSASSSSFQLPAALPAVYPPPEYGPVPALAVDRQDSLEASEELSSTPPLTEESYSMDVERGYPPQRTGRSWLSASRWETPAIHPQLYEVLSRKTRAPVDLYSFYIYMRDIQYAVDYLDFWLDVSQHMSLCRHYVRALRRSVLADTPDPEAASKRSSGGGVEVAEAYDGAGGGPSEKRNYSDNRVSQMLRDQPSSQHSHSNSQQSNTSRPSPHQSTPRAPGRPGHLSSSSNSPATGQDNSGSSSSPHNAINRQDVRASAERILYTYLLAGSEREIILPQSILNEIVQEIEQNNRDDPEVFDAAQDYVYQAMNRDAFPGFLQSKALGNLIPISMTFRVTIGLLALWAALWAGFVLIFLDESRRTRCWLILPFTIATYFLNSYQWMLDPIVALAGFSEYTLLNFNRIHEQYVRRLLVKRAIVALFTFLVLNAALLCLFILVPGYRL